MVTTVENAAMKGDVQRRLEDRTAKIGRNLEEKRHKERSDRKC